MDYIKIEDGGAELLISTNEHSNLITLETTREDIFGLSHCIVIDLDTKDIKRVIKFLTKHK